MALMSACIVPCSAGGVRLLTYAVSDVYMMPYVSPLSRLTGRTHHAPGARE